MVLDSYLEPKGPRFIGWMSGGSLAPQAFSGQLSGAEAAEQNLHPFVHLAWLHPLAWGPTSLKSAFTAWGQRTFWMMMWLRVNRHLLGEAHPKAKPFLTFAWPIFSSSGSCSLVTASGHHLIQTHKTPVIGKGHRLFNKNCKGRNSAKRATKTCPYVICLTSISKTMVSWTRDK